LAAGIGVLVLTAASIGFFHTLFGPDHYLPFIMMGRARNWSQKKTGLVTFICGLGHVLSSILLGAIGVVLGLAVANLEIFESVRGEMASWLLMIFGYIYLCYGLYVGIRGNKYKHTHSHSHGLFFWRRRHDHEHTHSPGKNHEHKHGVDTKKTITPWALFVIFVLGPCEPLIPILMYPAFENSFWGLALVTLVFAAVTITTMMVVVFLLSKGLKKLPLGKLERWTHAIAGGVILLCGISMVFLGL
jgi:ABC-type nickel/cobalt efflux system permease component RcnA